MVLIELAKITFSCKILYILPIFFEPIGNLDNDVILMRYNLVPLKKVSETIFTKTNMSINARNREIKLGNKGMISIRIKILYYFLIVSSILVNPELIFDPIICNGNNDIRQLVNLRDTDIDLSLDLTGMLLDEGGFFNWQKISTKGEPKYCH